MDPVWGVGLFAVIALVLFILHFLEPPFPEIGDTVQVKDTLETGKVIHVRRITCGFYETFATCRVRFANGFILDYKENELKIMPQSRKQAQA